MSVALFTNFPKFSKFSIDCAPMERLLKQRGTRGTSGTRGDRACLLTLRWVRLSRLLLTLPPLRSLRPLLPLGAFARRRNACSSQNQKPSRRNAERVFVLYFELYYSTYSNALDSLTGQYAELTTSHWLLAFLADTITRAPIFSQFHFVDTIGRVNAQS